MKKLKLLIIVSILTFTNCDNNDDAVTTVSTDGFTINATFYDTENAYITIDQIDSNNDGLPDYYNFFFTDGRMTDTFGDVGVGHAYAYSLNTTSKLVKLKVLADTSNPSLTTSAIAAGQTYVASSILTNGFSSGFSTDSFIGYNLQVNAAFGTDNGIDYSHISENLGTWYYPGTMGPTVTINAINIDYSAPTNSTIDIDYTFLATDGTLISGHYEGTLGIILD
ncbi:hypothetical protein [uncultured Winogradskyella sp.]|uniref:hypothetical protein n=1 Tax=uncultured Winogradskyella sp. TaxID=395353 RepID=UPI002618EF15|nr:hypothetical protein [uncultured Winogradskyella sp.]